MGPQKEYRKYSPNAGDRIRIAIHYNECWRPIFWFKVASDGSIYLGRRYINITELRKGSQPTQDGIATIRYADGQTVNDPSLVKAAKLSFHASGTIHAAGERLSRQPLRELDEQQLLCHVAFQHPQCFATVPTSEIKKRDVCLRYPIDESYPIQAQFFVAPHEKARWIDVESAIKQMNLLFEFSGLTDVPGLSAQLVLHHGPAGSWPPYSYVVYQAQAKP